ncbi:hypothetical protein EW145_g600 [Phellinidium pouzarii]|uniref:Ribosome biogenesis protein ERB1 n=1 Tax=Phellinidium pouzarii TaxID=167371 RepID=A0A4S4LJL3_9AGAM|nr:hypothetical protein EW145_g600 [Phellinidium pouzarii]
MAVRIVNGTKKRKHASERDVPLARKAEIPEEVDLEMQSEDEGEDGESGSGSDEEEADAFPELDLRSDTESDEEDEEEEDAEEDESSEEVSDEEAVSDDSLHVFPKAKLISSNITGKPKTVYPEIEPNYDSDSSTEDDPNRIGNVPMHWYDDLPHIGYNINGKKVLRPARGDELDKFLKTVEDPSAWTSGFDKSTQSDKPLTAEELEIIRRLHANENPDADYDPYEPTVEWFSGKGKEELMPLSAAPEPKRRWVPSKWEKQKVMKIVRAIRQGRIIPNKPKATAESRFFSIWSEPSAEHPPPLPAPKPRLPTNAESYNPPEEYLPIEEERKQWEATDKEDRERNFLPQKYSSLRLVPAYDQFIQERFSRQLDLYLAPRIQRKKLNLNPDDLIPKLPSPSSLKPFPNYRALRVVHEGDASVRCLSVSPDGAWAVSGDEQGTVSLWEILVGREVKKWKFDGKIGAIQWCPRTDVDYFVVGIEGRLHFLIPPNISPSLLSATLILLSPATLPPAPATPSPIKWTSTSSTNFDPKSTQPILTLDLPQSSGLPKQIVWHKRGDYVASVSGTDQGSVWIHQISRRHSQAPFKKVKGSVQLVLFHPLKPHFFVATQRYVRIYDLSAQKLVKALMPGLKWISSMDIHPSGDHLIVGGYDRKLCWFDLELSNKPYKILRYHTRAIRSLAFHPSYPLFASSSDDGTVQVFHARVYSDLMTDPLLVPLKILRGHAVSRGLGVLQVRWVPGQPWLVSAGADGNVVMDSYDIDKLTAQCKSSDVDAKVDAVSRLQQAFEAGVELTDAEGIINTLKTCLRASNQHLSTTALAALPPFFALLTTGRPDDSNFPVDAVTLRNALTAFLPAGGLIDKLGDNRERTREKARESMVVLAGLSFRCGTSSLYASARGRDAGKGPETPLMVWERFVREGGLQSKVWRAILTLVNVRRLHSMFPLKPYLPHLVDSLEDMDGTVRECARQSVVELFTGPAVTDAARADLKKEMTRKNVRKTIVDSVLQKLMTCGSGSGIISSTHSETSSDTGEAPQKKEYIPPSLKLAGRQLTSSSGQTAGSRTISTSTSLGDVNSRPGSQLGNEVPVTPTAESGEITAVYIASAKDLESEFAPMLKYFEGKETEHNWAARERSITHIRGMLKGEAHVRFTETFLSCLKGGIIDASFKTLASLRTTVAVNTCNLYSELAVALGAGIDSFSEPLLSHLVPMSPLTKKIIASLSQQTADTIITIATPQPKTYLNLLWQTMQDKNVASRLYSINHIKVFLEAHGQHCKYAIESSGTLDILEKCIKKTLGDSNPGVRESARSTFWVFEGLWKERGAVIINGLDGTAKKQLQKVCPVPGKTIAPSTPNAKKNSVAAAIAASRAKARAIATAPPSLRHQATSTSHILQASSTSPIQRSPSRSSTSPKAGLTTIRRSPSDSRSMSPVSPPTRRVASFSPTSSSGMVAPAGQLHNRTHSIEMPASPSSSHRRFVSYQFNASSPSSDILETAVNTALPSSTRTSLDDAVSTALPASPQQHKSRVPSARIPSPTRRSDIHTLISLANREPHGKMHLHGRDDSLLLAQTIPLPDDSDSEDESHMMSFSAPYEKYHSSLPKTNTSSLSAGSPPPNAPEPIVEDALRARAEQAESAAERLLELVEPDDDTAISPIPASLLRTNGSSPKSSKQNTVLKSRTNEHLPSTPVNKKSTILRQAALFKDSPAYKGSSSLIDVLRERKHETGWWLKRMSLVDKGSPLRGTDPAAQVMELKCLVSALEDGTADVSILKKLALLCLDNAVHDSISEMSTSFSYPSSPSPMVGKLAKLGSKISIWDNEKIFDRMFDALMNFLTLERSDEELEYGLIALWEILDNQASLVEGREAAVFTHLLQIRFCNKINVLEATNSIRDALVARIEPVFGLTTLHASIRAFYAEPLPEGATQEVKAASYAFGLIALGKFILRLPAEILEDELPRLKMTLTAALSDSSSLVVRESAATCIIASQLVLRDETHLFTLLDGLSDEKKNLLTYLFDKHGARGHKEESGTEKLEREMRRLDGRTNTPPRST